MRLLPTAISAIGMSHTLQNISYRRRFEERYVNQRKETALIGVTYYEFIAIINFSRIKVVIKEIDGDKKIFLSVIPLFNQKMPSRRMTCFDRTWLQLNAVLGNPSKCSYKYIKFCSAVNLFLLHKQLHEFVFGDLADLAGLTLLDLEHAFGEILFADDDAQRNADKIAVGEFLARTKIAVIIKNVHFEFEQICESLSAASFTFVTPFPCSPSLSAATHFVPRDMRCTLNGATAAGQTMPLSSARISTIVPMTRDGPRP